MIRAALLSSVAVLGLAACDPVTYPSIDRQAGLAVGAGFGEATAQNLAVNKQMTAAVAHMNTRFAAAVPTTITFDFDKSFLTASARATLNRQADFMRQFPEVGFSVYGYADSPGSNAYNEALGLRRANAALDYLVSQGVSRGKLKALVSYGEERPAVPGAGRERANRRVVTTVSGIGGGAGAGLGMNGKYAEVVFREFVGSAEPQPTIEGQSNAGAGGEGGGGGGGAPAQ